MAWEDDFADYLDEYRQHQNVKALLTMLESLFRKYRIGLRERAKPRALAPEDLEVVCYMFLSRHDAGELAIEV